MEAPMPIDCMKTIARPSSWILTLSLLLLGMAGCGKQDSGTSGSSKPSSGASPQLTGYWVGSLEMGPTSLTLGFDLIASEPGKYRTTFDSLTQGVKDLPGTASQDGNQFTLELDLKQGGLARYTATLSADGQTLTGNWRQGPATLPLEMKRGDRSKAVAESDPIFQLSPEELPLNKAAGEKLSGDWKGTLEVGGNKLRLVFSVGRRPEGGCVTSLTSVDQGNTKLPVNKTLLQDQEVTLSIPAIQGTFVGTLEGADKISGKWSQAGAHFPLQLERNKK